MPTISWKHWLRDVLGGLVDEECTDLDLTCFDDDCIHVVSSNWQPLPTYENYFRECRAGYATWCCFISATSGSQAATRCTAISMRLSEISQPASRGTKVYGRYRRAMPMAREPASRFVPSPSDNTPGPPREKSRRRGWTGVGIRSVGAEFFDRHHIHSQGRGQKAEQGRIRRRAGEFNLSPCRWERHSRDMASLRKPRTRMHTDR